MEDKGPSNTRRHGSWWWWALIPALPVMYVLGMAPLRAYVKKNSYEGDESEIMRTLKAPLWMACDEWGWLDSAYDDYQQWWYRALNVVQDVG